MITAALHIRTKLAFITLGIYGALGIITCRLMYLQIHLMSTFFSRSQKNFLRIDRIPSPRGNIVDRHGTLLVTNRPVVHLYWQGNGNHTFDGQAMRIFKLLEPIIGKSLVGSPEQLQELRDHERHYKKALLAQNISFEQLSQIEELLEHPQVRMTTHCERFYPYSTLASHTLGYLTAINAEPVGKMGLEMLLQEELKGEPGSLERTINSYGKNLREVEIKKALAGSTIETTLDLPLQRIAEQVFPVDQAGSFILMDPETGALVSLVSRPTFDPALFLSSITVQGWQELQEKRCFVNRAFNACYPPGSFFKLVTISAALEQGLTTPQSSVLCQGHTTFCGRQYHCAHLEGHGCLSICQAVAKSCNILFFNIGKHIDIDLLADYAHRFGLGSKTGTLFTEKEGLIPTRAWKRRTYDERWWQGETLSAAIGQSFLLVTPIQIARMIAGIFSGSLPKPRILASEPIELEPLNIQPDTLAFLRQTMLLAVTEGTGQRVHHIKHIRIYGKTSTAQTSQLDKRELGVRFLEIGWFAAHFTYKD
jgi:penicillin-binding protein 2